jgi:hypothetical protein
MMRFHMRLKNKGKFYLYLLEELAKKSLNYNLIGSSQLDLALSTKSIRP